MDPQTAEAGEAYLNALGFRSLIEWMTAEVLLSRPEDPLAFIRGIVDEKLGERPPGEKYQGDHAMSYIKQCYAAASASADENGRIIIKPRKIAPPSNTAVLASPATADPVLIKRLAVLEKVIEACRVIAMQLNPMKATTHIIKQACVVLNAERSTLFTYEKSSNMLILKVSEGAADIRVPFGKGIAGTVAATGKAVNLVDAYSDPNFDPHYDVQTGYKTRSMLCVPVRNGENSIVGVVQVLNKAGATEKEQTFTDVDAEVLGILASQAGIALQNAKIHHEACKARERVKEVLSIVQDMHRDLGFISLMFTMSTRIQRLINSDRCTLYIVDRAKNELWTLQGEVNIRVPLNQGISGAAAEANQSINLENAYDDPRFNQEFDQKHDYVTRSVLAMPLRDHVGEVIGVVQLINKMSDPWIFTTEDEELLGTFLQIAGPILETSQSHLPKSTQAKDAGGPEFPGKVARTAAPDVVEMNVISENDEEEIKSGKIEPFERGRDAAVMRAVSPLRHRDPQLAGSPKFSSRVSDSQNAGHVDDARLLRAIQALDEDTGTAVTTSAWKVCEAFGFFLELLLQWEQSAKQSLVAKAELTMIWEARIFSCLKRFVAKKKHVDFRFVGCPCCDSSGGDDVPCVQRLVCYTLIVVIFFMARDSRMASAVVKNELHGLLCDLFFETQRLQSKYSETPIPTVSSSNAQGNPEVVDSLDLLLALDPFDWCFQSTCIQLMTDEEKQRKKKRDAAFLIPIGIRSLIYLLAGEALPLDEITEYETKLRRHPSGGDLYRVRQASLTKKKRLLPSIFTFPTDADSASNSSQDITTSAVDSNSMCSRKDDPAFRVIRSHLALQHMALRAIVALLHNLRRSSPERKLLLSGGDCIQMLILHSCSFLDQYATKSQERAVSTVGLLSCQKIALEPRMLGQIAQCGLSLLHNDEVDAFLKKQPQFRQQFAPFLQATPVAVSTSWPSAATKTQRKSRNQKKPAAVACLSLAERLQATREESRQEIAANHLLSPLKKELELERSLRRQQLRSQCENLEQLRVQLSQSLSLLHSGRPHADPTQSFRSWIASLPTIEKKEQEKRSNELMRQQYAIEMQLQHDEARKQRLWECVMMQQNDSDALSETEHDRKEQKRLDFLHMHEEMRLLQLQQQREDQQMIGGSGDLLMQHDAIDQDDDQQVNEIEARMFHAETLSAQRKARQKKLDDNQTRLLWVRQRKQEAKELERMTREDLYYVEKLLRAKQLEAEQRKQAQLSAKQSGNPIEEQQRKIERMRQLDLERRIAEKEGEHMRTEDLFARQLRYVETERRCLEAQQEKLARKYMEAQEYECHLLWTRLEQEQKKFEDLEAKRLRVEARKLQKTQRQYEAQVLAAWIKSWDEYSNVYYYNTVTGVSQWENPFTTATLS